MDKKKISTGMYAFRVTLRAKNTNNGSSEILVQHRQSHRKSRAGCKACRLRHRKCDEGKPKCRYCDKKQVDCDYTKPALVQGPAPTPSNLWPGSKAPLVLSLSGDIRHTDHDLYLLHHFTQVTAHTYNSPGAASVYSNQVLSLALEYPYLMHAMMAVSSCHLQHMDIDAKEYRRPEALHCHFASQGLRSAVSMMSGPKDCDAVLSTAMMLNTLTFCLADYRDEPPFEGGSTQEPRYDWLRIQIGLTTLLCETSPYHPESCWLFLFMATDNFTISEPPETNLGEQLAEICGVDENSTEENNPYYEVLKFLTPILARKPSEKYLLLYLRTIGAINSDFINRMETMDIRALLIFAHWLALMCSIDQWWCVRRTRRECWTICDILSTKMAPNYAKLLEFPANACGYPLLFSLVENITDVNDASVCNT